MRKGLQKLIKTMLLEKYPFILDVYVVKSVGISNLHRENCFEVSLVLFEKDLGDTWGTREYIEQLAKYMGIPICGVYNEYVDEEEWEQIKSDNED